ncbi:YbaY family lipoprotein [Bartonella tamiae]|uniref:DUF306 domain-containing protein n=1 Tax=Bartonella tamiae Th239 TaxID=1094558 RepID=J1JWH6_9HYPH|nr:YbaY family lipoprotein [Bartonella tamiae]EJF88915.1 hypothetical protein ME5_01466 [Bartonella tamiae Th239]EJF94835.1 hypothetical protein MEG_00416 [Bartonella tamiae Th307]
MLFLRRLFIAGVALSAITGSVISAHATTLYLKGDVVYRERMALPENAEVEVSLNDVSLADAPSTTISSAIFKPHASSPIPYELKFDSAVIDPKHRYALQARISVDGKLLFVTTENHAVFAGDDNDTQIFVKMVAAAPETFNRMQLVGDWIIKDIDDKKSEGSAPLTITFSQDGLSSIYAGCNRMSSAVTIDASKMVFGTIMATRMACDDVLMKQEQQLSKIISRVQNYTLKDGTLTLLDAQSKPLLVLSRE